MAVGVVTASVQVTEHDETLWSEIQAIVDRFSGLTVEQVRQFPPVKARVVRLNILKATEGPTIWEFQVFAPGK